MAIANKTSDEIVDRVNKMRSRMGLPPVVRQSPKSLPAKGKEKLIGETISIARDHGLEELARRGEEMLEQLFAYNLESVLSWSNEVHDATMAVLVSRGLKKLREHRNRGLKCLR
jgi:hypothetical protein